MVARMTRFDALLGDVVAIDGGLATQLEDQGADLSGNLWSARLLEEDPEQIVRAHRAYVAAGARVLITSSYQASRKGFRDVGIATDRADRLLGLSIELAGRAIQEENAEDRVLVAASVGPYGAILHDGSEYRGNYGVSKADLVDFHRERLDVLVASGPDLIAVETIPDVLEAEAIIEVLADHPDVPAWISFSCKDELSVCAGQPFAEAVQVAASAPTVRAVGINCTAPSHVSGLLRSAVEAGGEHLPFVVYPNAGRVWDGVNSVWLGSGDDLLPEAAVREWARLGARLIGGCCGLGPEAIASVASVTKSLSLN